MSSTPGYAWDGAAPNRINGAWEVWERDPNDEWQHEAGQLAIRAADLCRNDPVMVALRGIKLIYTHGSKGLKHRSLVELDGDPSTKTAAEAKLRRDIEREIARASARRNLDATGLATRRELEWGVDDLATTGGDGFLVRCFLPNRPGAYTANCWRTLRRDRVSNPPGRSNDKTIYEGFELDANGAPVGIHIGPPKRGAWLLGTTKEDWTYVPWYDGNGMPCVIHRVGDRTPGAYRGVTKFAPNLAMARQIKGAIDAYVVAKRIQACHPVFISCEDPQAAAKKDRNGAVWGPNTTLEPGKVYYVGLDAKVNFPTFSFQGQDMDAFLNALNRNQTASWGVPIDVVLAQLTNTNMAASRSAWLQLYRQADRWQDDHIEQVSEIIDATIIYEAVLTGRIVPPAGMSMHDLMAGDYIRPPRSMPDPLKEAQAVEKWASLGRDLTGLFAESGVDLRKSVAQREQDNRTMADAGLGETPSAAATQARDAEFIERVAAAAKKIEEADVEGLQWPMVVAAAAATSAPAAFITASIAPPTTQEPADPTTPTEQPPVEAPE